MTREDIIRMAREAGIEHLEHVEELRSPMSDGVWLEDLEHFAALVAAAEREKVAQWMMQRGYATGHGDTTEDLLRELTWQVDEWIVKAVTAEREECAKVCDDMVLYTGFDCAVAIRARGNNAP
jgi:hypothetical protein